MKEANVILSGEGVLKVRTKVSKNYFRSNLIYYFQQGSTKACGILTSIYNVKHLNENEVIFDLQFFGSTSRSFYNGTIGICELLRTTTYVKEIKAIN